MKNKTPIIADAIANFLSKKGVKQVFELSGGMITLMLDALHRNGQIQIISVHHEQSAAFAAEAVGRLTGVPGVAMATSGPGATNLLTGIGSCYFDSSPAVFITGQVNRYEQKGDRPIRQLGFQETDIVAMAKPITKAAWQITTPEDILPSLEKAFRIAMEGRPGPVLLDIPMDLQKTSISGTTLDNIELTSDAEVLPPDSYFHELFTALQQAERPLILAGGGLRSAGAVEAFHRFLEIYSLPVVHSLMAVDVLPYTHPLRVGLIGSYGNRWANIALAEADCLLVLGSRLDVRQTGSDPTAFRDGRPIFHIDIEQGEINNRVTGCHGAIAELRPFLEKAREFSCDIIIESKSVWMERISTLRALWPDTAELKEAIGINPNAFIHQLSSRCDKVGAYVIDVGQHQMWAAQSLELGANQRFLTSGGMGAMGFALPAALGAAFALAGNPVVVIAGDGGFQCNIQELETIARNQLPVKIVILNNRCHGMVRQFQDSYFDKRYQSTLWGYSAPEFKKIAEAYGIPARTITKPDEAEEALAWMIQDETKPALLNVMIDTMTNVYPKIAFGRPISDMEPFVKPVAMEST